MTSTDHVETIHGVEVHDPFRWLEDFDDPKVRRWVEEQDALARQRLDRIPERAAIAERLAEVLYVEQRSVPIKRRISRRGETERWRYFYSVKAADQEKAVHYVSDGKDGPARVLLDPHTMSDDGSLSIGGVYPNEDGSLVAYLEKPNNADYSNLKLLDVASGRLLMNDTIEGVRYTAPSWLPDGSGFYYTWTPNDSSTPPEEILAHGEVRFHRLGTDPATDAVVRGASGDPSVLVGAYVSDDGKYLLAFERKGWSRAEVYIQFLEREGNEFVPLVTGKEALYSVEAYGDEFYILTNEGAPHYRVFKASAEHLGREHWQEIVPEDPESVIDELNVVGRHLVLSRLRHATTQLEVRRLDGSLLREVELPGLGVASTLIGRQDSDEAYFSYASFTHPTEIFETSVTRGGRSLVSRVQVPVQPERFEVKQVHYPSKDGTQISMFIVHDKKLVLDGSNPTRLYGYGGFNASMTPSFAASVFPWLERGGVFAMPNLRGGGEYGEEWHRAGMLQNKQNVFDDFIAAAEYLIEQGYTSVEHLGISGGSNGGLLVGAAMTQRPDLFEAVSCAVPVLDMVRYHEVGLGKAWIPEYGDPDDPEHFRFLFRYSPYHRVTAGTRYPALLVLAADTDDRVDPMHARKFTAAVQAASTRDEPKALLRVERNAGHGGADLRRSAIARLADEYAFLWEQLTR